MIKKAYEFAKKAHGSSLDDIGKNYFQAHIEQVVSIIKMVTKDPEIIASAYLHDVIEDCGVTYNELVKEFGSRVADLVMEVTHEGKKDNYGRYFPNVIEDCGVTYNELVKEFGSRVADLVMEVTHEGKKDNYGRYFPRLETREGIVIKFADRLSNLSRMEAWSDKRKKHYLRKSKFWKDGKDLK